MLEKARVRLAHGECRSASGVGSTVAGRGSQGGGQRTLEG